MCTNEKAKQTFLQHLPVPVRHVIKSLEVVKIPVQVRDYFEILMHTSKRQQIIFKFLFIQSTCRFVS